MITAVMEKRKMDKYIEKESAVSYPVMPKKYRKYPTMNLDDAYEQGWYDLEDLLEKLPAADVVEVCRCEHCSKSMEHLNGRWCKIHQTVVQNSDYCSWGTKR